MDESIAKSIDTEQCDDDASQMVCVTNASLGSGLGQI